MRLKVFKRCQHAATFAAGLVADLQPARRNAAAPDLKAVCCVSSPAHCAEDFYGHVQAALDGVLEKSKELGWAEDNEQGWESYGQSLQVAAVRAAAV